MSSGQLGGSFRDPSGFLFKLDGVLYRQVNQSYSVDYSFLVESGLYEKLVKVGLLVCHKETSIPPQEPDLAFKVIQPERIPFISYPYEWSFSELKDASAYNIQFQNGSPTLIDTLSFEIYKEGSPWVAYKQFCQHFLAPLALMSYTDVRLNQLMRIYIDGIPLDLASR
ncbi:SAM-dependent methyltransferase, partial [bacterium]|nr:SAM-dependent methyltransferase [bacterium]